ncbi:MAG: hypothetical protein RR376_23235 [Janthinobacterium sp.]
MHDLPDAPPGAFFLSRLSPRKFPGEAGAMLLTGTVFHHRGWHSIWRNVVADGAAAAVSCRETSSRILKKSH